MTARRKDRSPAAAPRPSPASPSRGARPRWRSPLLLAVAATLLLLAATAEERTYGTISDEQQMLGTAVALATTGEIGIARGQLFTLHRAAGDAVSPYGMGQPLLAVLPVLLAPAWERSFGPGSSQSLLVLLQLLLITGAAAASGLVARRLAGGDPRAAVLAVAATAFGSPLWAYGALGTSEPLQALCLAGAVAAASHAVVAGGRRALLLAGMAGLAAGYAVLAKSVNVAVAPFTLLPLLLDLRGEETPTRPRLVLSAAAGSAGPLAAWLAFEVVRFGRPLAPYGDQRFTNPVGEGLLQLLAGPTKGLLLYFPLLPLALLGIALFFRARPARGTAAAAAAVAASLLATSAAWWGWDGGPGWGPRLLVPALPLLAAAGAAAAAAASRERGPWLRRAAVALAALGAAVNVLGILQNEAAVAHLVSLAPPAPATADQLRRLPPSFVETGPSGEKRVPREVAAAGDAAFSPLRLHPFVLGARLAGGGPEAVEARLVSPPWLGSHPDARPDFGAGSGSTASLRAYLLSSPRFPVLLDACRKARAGDAAAFNTAWGNAVADQVLRLVDVGRPEAALPLAETLFTASPSGYAAALEAESLRALGRLETARAFVDGLPPRLRGSPSLAVVDALLARDAGQEARARQILAEVAGVFPRPGITEALRRPLAEWPRNLHEMTGNRLVLPFAGASGGR